MWDAGPQHRNWATNTTQVGKKERKEERTDHLPRQGVDCQALKLFAYVDDPDDMESITDDDLLFATETTSKYIRTLASRKRKALKSDSLEYMGKAKHLVLIPEEHYGV